MIQNVDCLQTAMIITNPVDYVGQWTQLECITTLTGVTVQDDNLTPDSEAEPESVYLKGAKRIGKFKSITCIGTVKLYR